MSDAAPEAPHHAEAYAVYQIPGMADASTRRDIEYRMTDAGSLTLDAYLPST